MNTAVKELRCKDTTFFCHLQVFRRKVISQPYCLKISSQKIIPIDYDDEMHYANNFLTIAPRHIMAVAGQSEELQQRLRCR